MCVVLKAVLSLDSSYHKACSLTVFFKKSDIRREISKIYSPFTLTFCCELFFKVERILIKDLFYFKPNLFVILLRYHWNSYIVVTQLLEIKTRSWGMKGRDGIGTGTGLRGQGKRGQVWGWRYAEECVPTTAHLNTF